MNVLQILKRNIMKNIIIICCIFLATGLYAQQEIILTKYTYNSLFFNPAYAGSHGPQQGTALIHYRNQWLGLEGAPTTFLAGTESSFFDNRVGFGLTLGSEKIGIEKRVDVTTNYAYRIETDKGYLSGGLRLGLSNYRTNFSELVNIQPGDPDYNRPDINYNALSFGGGLYYNTKSYYAGLSVPAIVALGNGDSYRAPHFYGHAGMIIGDKRDRLQFEPSVLLKFQKAAPLQVTLGLNVWLRKDFAIGGHYRSDDALALSAELHYKDRYQFAAAYDFTISDIRKYSNGTIELLMGYRFSRTENLNRVRNIRFGGRF